MGCLIMQVKKVIEFYSQVFNSKTIGGVVLDERACWNEREEREENKTELKTERKQIVQT